MATQRFSENDMFKTKQDLLKNNQFNTLLLEKDLNMECLTLDDTIFDESHILNVTSINYNGENTFFSSATEILELKTFLKNANY